MARTGQPFPLQNRILLALPPGERDRVLALLEPQDLALRQVLHEAGEPIAHVWFVEAGVVSHLAVLEDGQEVEVGLAGPEGLVGYAAALGATTSHTEAMVQAPGRALRMPVEAFRAEVARGGPLPLAALRFAHSMHVQSAQGAACNARHGLGERLARWLLMMHDRVGTDEMPVTHEFIAMMLGVRRSGVTVALGTLEKAGVVLPGRGAISVLDRARLEGASCECYAAIRREADSLLG